MGVEMTPVLGWSAEALRVALVLGAPLLAAALAVGLVVGVVQTLTQVNEPVVGLVPRLVAVVVAALVLLPWLASRWVGFAGSVFEAIPGLVAGG